MEPNPPSNDLVHFIQRLGDEQSWLREDAWSIEGKPSRSLSNESIATKSGLWGERRFRTATGTIIRMAAVFPDQRLAVLADQGYGDVVEWTSRWPLARGVEAAPDTASRAIRLKESGRSRRSAMIVPLTLPHAPQTAARGSLAIDPDHPGDLILRQPIASASPASATPAKRRWLMPLVLSWNPARNRKPLFWRTLTVSQKSRVCGPGVAFGARISWGDETYLIYRSLAAPALRIVLGHQTKAKTLVANFTSQGELEPLLQANAAPASAK